MVVVEVKVGVSAGRMGKGSVAADCAIMYRSRGASSDDVIGAVCVRISRSRLQTKLDVYSLVKR